MLRMFVYLSPMGWPYIYITCFTNWMVIRILSHWMGYFLDIGFDYGYRKCSSTWNYFSPLLVGSRLMSCNIALQKNRKIVTTKSGHKVVTKWSLERYSDHLVTTKCGLRKSRHKDKLVTKWSQSVTTINMVTDNDHYNVVTDLLS